MFSPSFEELRDKLERQYDEPNFNTGSGLSPEEIRPMIDAYLSEHKNQPHILTKARVFSYILENAQLSVDPFEFYADKVNHGGILGALHGKWMKEIDYGLPEHHETDPFQTKYGAYYAYFDTGHTSPNWRNLLGLGISGLRGQADKKLGDPALSKPQRDFYTSVSIVYGAVMSLMKRLADEAERYHTPRTDYVAADLRYLAENPPETFHQAMQLAHLFHQLQEMEGEAVRAMASFDRMYYRFYRHDIDNGILTREQAKEMIKYLFFKYTAIYHGKNAGKNFMLAGTDIDGNDCVNELSWLALETFAEMDAADVKLTIRIANNTQKAFLRKAFEYVRAGKSSMIFFNDDICVKTLIKHGKNLREARDYVNIGCWEPSAMGEEVMCSGAGGLNLAKMIEFTFFDGKDIRSGKQIGLPVTDPLDTFEAFFSEYKRQLRYIIGCTADAIKSYEEPWEKVHPSPLFSGTMDSCMENGKDVSQAGARYNTSGISLMGLGSAADSLTAVKKLVYDNKDATLDGLRAALENDWEGYDLLHARALRCEKWGNNQEEPDRIAVEIAKFAAEIINNESNMRGGDFQPSLASIELNVNFGKATSALPDGHTTSQSISKNTNPTAGMEIEGVTAILNSGMKIDATDFPDGSVFDIILHPSATKGEEGIDAMITLVTTFFKGGGMALNYNVLDAETLRAAKQNPQEYCNLQVRVSGYNQYFINLSETMQDDFIKQAEGEGI